MSVKKAVGNMYPWVSHTHTHLRGECPHGCRYCYVQAIERRFRSGHYAGPLRLDEQELCCSYDTPAIRRYAEERGLERPVVFVEHCNDLFAGGVPIKWMFAVLDHCRKFDDVGFVFQTKNIRNLRLLWDYMPNRVMVGTTVETDSHDVVVEHNVYKGSCQPETPQERLCGLEQIRSPVKFVTVEPVLKMNDPVLFARVISWCRPAFVNIGADSKNNGLPEPSRDQLLAFIGELQRLNIPIRQKTNLERLLVGDQAGAAIIARTWADGIEGARC